MRVSLLILFFFLIAGCAAPALRIQEDPSLPKLTVVTFNVNYSLAGDSETLKAIGSVAADLILLQETTPEWELVTRREYGSRFPHVKFWHDHREGGLAVLSKYKISKAEILESPVGRYPAVRLEVSTPLGNLQILNIHLHPPVTKGGNHFAGYFTTFGIRLKEMKSFFQRLDPMLPTIVAGDFNEESDGSAIQLLIKEGFLRANPGKDTWRYKTIFGTLRRALDHVMYRQLSLVSSRVLSKGKSDHLPLVSEFQAPRVK